MMQSSIYDRGDGSVCPERKLKGYHELSYGFTNFPITKETPDLGVLGG